MTVVTASGRAGRSIGDRVEVAVAVSNDPADLALRFRAGDHDALRDAYLRHGPAVYHLAVASLRNSADAEDVTQLSFVAAWNARTTYDPEKGSLLGWLLAITRRKVADRYRTLARERQAVVAAGAAADADAEAPADLLLERLVVVDALAELPEAQQQVLHLAFYEDMTQVEIAENTGLPLGTVKSHIRRGMAALRRRWEVDRSVPSD